MHEDGDRANTRALSPNESHPGKPYNITFQHNFFALKHLFKVPIDFPFIFEQKQCLVTSLSHVDIFLEGTAAPGRADRCGPHIPMKL